MAFKPDYGSTLLAQGYPKQLALMFYNLLTEKLAILGHGQFTVCATVMHEGAEHAMSVDFSEEVLHQFLRRASVATREQIRGELLRDPNTPRNIELWEMLPLSFEGHFGKEQRAPKETFVPVVVTRVLEP